MQLGILLFIGAILLVVMIHETGHFVVAKRYGFKATRFFVGFGPTLWSIRRGETEYGVKALPLGGFVKIIGMNPYEEVPEEDRARSYPNKPRRQRAFMILGGPATHWPLAFLILFITAMTIGYPTGEATNEVAQIQSRIAGESTPAAEAGLKPGDRIVGVGGEETSEWDRISGYIKSHQDETVVLAIRRNGELESVRVRLGKAIFDEEGALVDFAPPGEELREPRGGETLGGFLGINPDPEFERLGPVAATTDSASKVWEYTRVSVLSVGEIFRQTFNGDLWDALQQRGDRTPEEGPVGVIGIGRIAGESIARGQFLSFIQLIVGITIFVGLINLVPLPPLDGGHLAVLAWESITGRAVDLRRIIPIAAAVISFFVMLSLAALYLDLVRPLDIPF